MTCVPGAQSVGALTRGSGSQLVNAACLLVPDVDARGNTVTHGFILVPATGPYVQQGGVRGHCIILHSRCLYRGYKRGERGREAPKSLLEEKLSMASIDVRLEASVRFVGSVMPRELTDRLNEPVLRDARLLLL